MDSVDLVARENEFKKLNKQLEMKTESLMKQIERDMQKQDFFSEITQNISLRQPSKHGKHCCNSPQTQDSPVTSPKPTPTKIKKKLPAKAAGSSVSETRVVCEGNGCSHCAKDNRVIRSLDSEFLFAFVNVNVQDKVLPPSFMKDSTSVESVCKFLASKVKLLQDQTSKLQATIDKKAAQCEKHLSQQADLESERVKFINSINSLTADACNARAKAAALQARLTEKEGLCERLRAETDRLGGRLRRAAAGGAAAEARSAALQQTVERLTAELQRAVAAEKEFRTASRELAASHESAISRLEARIKALTTRIERQAALIDNLKRQNTLLTADGAVRALEKEYCNFLNKDF